MAKSANITLKIIGLILLVVGAGLAWWGYQLSGALAAQLTKTISGALPDAIMYRYIGGAASAVAGLVLVARG